MDSLHSVIGIAATNRACEVKVLETGTSREITKEPVQGKFSISYLASGPFPAKVDISAYCDGTMVKELKAIAPRDRGAVDLGILPP